MTLIYETESFVIEAVDKPHVDRDDGGHIKITPKKRVIDRQDLTPKQAIELMQLTMVVGKAMKSAMNQRGIDIGRINYQDMGNWTLFDPKGPYLHYHIYGRAKSAKYQKYGETVYTPLREKNPEYYAKFKPLNEGDIKEIRKQIEKIIKEPKYKDSEWHL
jgi:diadenosine tetraphosphate (Ap4A) HIT family hydrolase